MIRRRQFISQTGSLLVSAGLASCATNPKLDPTTAAISAPRARRAGGESPFRHGVASGDPLQDRVIIWTRAKLPDSEEPLTVQYWCALDRQGQQRVAEGEVLASPEHDHTLHIDLTGLTAGTTYFYGFTALGHDSPVGRTKTIATDPDRVRLAVGSCSNYAFGFFNSYARIAERNDLDAVLHLGDYIYEVAAGQYGIGEQLGRVPEPAHTLVSLQDYRTRYAQYRTDPDLQAAHGQHPFIPVWDDHEFANNAYWLGAAAHDETQGPWEARRAAALQAYAEWLPVRWPEPGTARLYRSFRFGQLCELIMLDGRLIGRDEVLERDAPPEALAAPERSMLGATQEQWLAQTLVQSTKDGLRWRILGQQTMMGQLRINDLIANPDQWDGYPASRSRLYDTLEQHGIDNLVVLSGDIHSSWAVELCRDPFDPQAYNPETSRGALGVEFICPGLASPSPYLLPALAELPALYRSTHPHIKYLEGQHRGYIVLDVNPQRVQAEWYLIPTVEQKTNSEFLDARFEVEAGHARLKQLDTTPTPA